MQTEKWLSCIYSLILITIEASGAFVGVNIGTETSHLPSASDTLSVLHAHQIKHVRMYDADHQVLKSLANTGIEVMVGVPNDQLLRIGRSQAEAAEWLDKNVAAFVPETNITYIAVGNEVLTTNPNAAPVLVSTMQFLHSALLANNLSQVKISSPHSMDMILKPFPPSEATFNSTWNSIMVEFLQFLKNSDSAFMLNAHPYNAYTRGEGTFPIDYALFQSVNSKKKIVDPNTLFEYSNMFDTMVDAAYYAMNALAISGVPVIVTESGWPWNGSSSDPAATVDNALVYNHNLIQHVLSGSGTPSQPTTETSAYIYELFNEDLHPGLLSEKNWGIVFPNGTATYSLNFEALSGNDSIVNGFFCIAKPDAKLDMVKLGLDWACGDGGADCSQIQPGQPCYVPNDLTATTSYAYNDYYQKKRASGGGCNFSDTAFLTNSDPSHGFCIFTGSPRRKPDGQGPPGSALSPANNDAINKGVSVQVLPFSYLLPVIILFSWLQGNLKS